MTWYFSQVELEITADHSFKCDPFMIIHSHRDDLIDYVMNSLCNKGKHSQLGIIVKDRLADLKRRLTNQLGSKGLPVASTV